MSEAKPYLVLARKYRPGTLEEVVGQSHVTQTLKNAVETGRIAHAYLLSGPRGVGKTTIERILAKCLNCEKGPTSVPCGKCTSCVEISEGNSMDVQEIDGASNRKIDDIRELREKIKFSSGANKYKVYIIDEVHMLTTEAFNALLKTLEEPPANVIFILGTTAPHRLPPTILSRCQWFALKRISIQDIVENLKGICEKENIKISDNSLYAISRAAEGALRDAQVSLDQIVSFSGNEVKDEDVNAMLGIIDSDLFTGFFSGISSSDLTSAITIIGDVVNSGYEIDNFVKGLQEYLRNLLVLKDGKEDVTQGNLLLVDLPREEVKKIKKESASFSEDELVRMLDVVSQAQKDLRQFEMRGQEKLILEMMAINLARDTGCSSQVAEDKVPPKRKVPVKVSNIPEAAADPPESPAPKMYSGYTSETASQKIEEPAKPVLLRSENENPAPEKSTVPSSEIPQAGGEEIVCLKDVLEGWIEVVRRLMEKRRGLADFFKLARPKQIRDKTILLSFNKELSFQKERAEGRENKNLIRSILKEVYGKELEIEFVAEEKKPAQAKDVKNEPIVRKVMDLFNARIVDRKKVEKEDGSAK